MKKKLSKNGGFTLVEMLIVVAIIAILVAVSIPLISSSLEKARDAADQANERAAKAEAAILLLQADDYVTVPGTTDNGAALLAKLKTSDGAYYDAKNGKLQSTAPTDKYGRCTGTGGIDGYCKTAHTNQAINIIYGTESNDVTAGEFKIEWKS